MNEPTYTVNFTTYHQHYTPGDTIPQAGEGLAKTYEELGVATITLNEVATAKKPANKMLKPESVKAK